MYDRSEQRPVRRATTIIAVRHKGRTSIAGDGQVSFDDTVLKATADKLRLLAGGKVAVGFAGGVADALTLFDRFEEKIKAHPRDVRRAAVELAKDWRTDRALRRLEAMLVAATRKELFLISGQGDVIEPDDAVLSVGSGSGYATSAARALIRHGKDMDSEAIVTESLKIAAEICVFTNDNIQVINL